MLATTMASPSQPEPAGGRAATATARLLAGAPGLAAALAQPRVLGVARALLDSHVRVAAAGCSGSSAEAAEWGCGFPHAAGDERGWVAALRRLFNLCAEATEPTPDEAVRTSDA